ncbi:hypothetical protein BH10CYA1_BH10CYA1_51690 [soil metagenome]
MGLGDSYVGDKAKAQQPEQSDGWLADNVLHPFVNGTGLVRVYDTIVDKPAEIYHIPVAKTFSADWCAQSLSGAAGAILPFVIAGKVTGMGMRAVGEEMRLTGASARMMTSESLAQIGGAGIYEFAQKPLDGQTRLGNAAGTMAGFALFTGGNRLLGEVTPISSSWLAKGAGRFAVGSIGGLGSYETTNLVAGFQGVQHQENWQERWQTMAQGGFVNVALPVVQEGANRVVDSAIHSRSWSKGMPIERELKNAQINDPLLQDLAHENPLARVKRVAAQDVEPQANVSGNAVILGADGGAAKLAHELAHLSLARDAEPLYRQIGDLSKSNPQEAEQAYYALRANIEAAARTVENQVQARTPGEAADQVIANPKTLGEQIAGNGKTYSDGWKAEWQKFRDDSTFRPEVEYGGKGILKSTDRYEQWMEDRIKVVSEDLAQKHTNMAEDAFRFMRGTYYRWAERFPKLLPQLNKAPVVNSVGDLHVENFGTWLDKKGRLIWGVNDFDEAYPLPYTNDLVRLLTSANMLREQGLLKLSSKEATDIVLDGYQQSLKDGGKAFDLSENKKLNKMAQSQMPKDSDYWKELDQQVKVRPAKNVPQDAKQALEESMPQPNLSLEYGERQAGMGSLGRLRIVARTEFDGETIAREAKALLPSASFFATGKTPEKNYFDQVTGNAVRVQNPLVTVHEGYMVRELAPTSSRIELGELSTKDARQLLWSMGYETANIHQGTKNAAGAILRDLNTRQNGWLVDAVKTMTESVNEEHKAWAKKQKK